MKAHMMHRPWTAKHWASWLWAETVQNLDEIWLVGLTITIVILGLMSLYFVY